MKDEQIWTGLNEYQLAVYPCPQGIVSGAPASWIPCKAVQWIEWPQFVHISLYPCSSKVLLPGALPQWLPLVNGINSKCYADLEGSDVKLKIGIPEYTAAV